ncbi:MAG: heme-binding protein [Deltaproteobacteria bacterium]|nr:heme-binding protein [Deltaproteobacteria bacterium]MBW2069787.1 heme-binding protein [Deltaproteobacteria bacterium]
MKISYPLAATLAAIAEAAAQAVGVPMVIALVDSEGSLLFFGRMDGSLPVSIELAVGKAYTAAALRLATQEVGKLAQPGKALYGIQHSHSKRIVLFGGGLPLRLKGKVVGGVGISGGTVEEDIQVAEAVVRALEQMESLSEQLKPVLATAAYGIDTIAELSQRIEAELRRLDLTQAAGNVSLLKGAVLLAFEGRT